MKDPDFRTFIGNERKKLTHYVRSLMRETADMDAEDVVQDVLTKIFENVDLAVPFENMAAYVYRSLRNRVIDYVRTRKPNLSLEAASDENTGEEGYGLIDLLHDSNPNALELLQKQEGQRELFDALETLSKMEKDVIIGHELEGTPFKELSQIWNVPQNTLLSHKSRAMKKLKKYYLKF